MLQYITSTHKQACTVATAKTCEAATIGFAEVTYDRSFGDYIHFSNKAEAHFKKAYGYLADFNGHAAQEQNQLKMFTFVSNPELSYESDWLKAGIFGEINLQRNRYSLASQYNNTPIEYVYGCAQH